jgi:hypothetical protein
MPLPAPIFPNGIYDGGVVVNEGSDEGSDTDSATDFILGSTINRIKSEIQALEEEIGPFISGALRGDFASLADRLAVSINSNGTIDFSGISAGPEGTFLKTVSGMVAWSADGSGLIDLNANELSSGLVPLGRLSGITTSQLAASANILGSQLDANANILSTQLEIIPGVAGSYTPLVNLTINDRGQVTAATNGVLSPINLPDVSPDPTGTYVRPGNVQVDIKGRIIAIDDVPIDLAIEVTGTLPNSNLVNSGALTVTAGTGLTGGGSVVLGGSTSLSLASVAVTPGTYIFASFSVDAFGRVSQVYDGLEFIQGLYPTGGVSIPRGVHKPASTSRNTTTTISDDPDLQLAIDSSGTYIVEGFIFFTGNGPGIKVRTRYSGGLGSNVNAINYTIVNQIQAGDIDLSDINDIEVGATIGTPAVSVIHINGVIKVTSAGLVIFRWAQNVLSGTNTTVYKHSYLKAQKVMA